MRVKAAKELSAQAKVRVFQQHVAGPAARNTYGGGEHNTPASHAAACPACLFLCLSVLREWEGWESR